MISSPLEQIGVNSYHHQAVKDLSPVFEVMAAAEDGLIVGIYMSSRKYIAGVQWHPEFPYESDLTGGKGITFATGTPISNSMTELYTNMRYLQYNTLQKLGLGNFDSWAATFGETQTAIEVA